MAGLGGAPVCFDAFAFQWQENFDPNHPGATSWSYSMTGVFSGGPLPSPTGGSYAWRYSFDMFGRDGVLYRFDSDFADFTLGTSANSTGSWFAADPVFSPDYRAWLNPEISDQPVTIADVVGIEIRQNDYTGHAVVPIAGCGPTGPACTAVPVPEPASLPLLLGAGVLFLLRARERSDLERS